MTKDGLWHSVLTTKYIKNKSMVAWLREKKFCTRRVSIIWRGFLQTLPQLGRHLAWQVGNGSDILIDVDLIISAHSSFILPEELRSYPEDLDICTLSQAHNILPDSQSYWYTADELGIDGVQKEAWDSYTVGLAMGGIHVTTEVDSLVWDYNKIEGSISAKHAYDCIVKS